MRAIQLYVDAAAESIKAGKTSSATGGIKEYAEVKDTPAEPAPEAAATAAAEAEAALAAAAATEAAPAADAAASEAAPAPAAPAGESDAEKPAGS